eukprot:UC4_evm1s45
MLHLLSFFIGVQCISTPISATYNIEDITIGEGSTDALAAKRIVNLVTRELVEVIHTQGGRIERVFLAPSSNSGFISSMAPRDIIQTHEGNATEIRENPHWAGEMLSPFANRIANGTYTFEGIKYFLPRNEVAPGCREDALHGFLWNKTMEVTGTEITNQDATLSLTYTFEGEPGYPLLLKHSINYTLSQKGLTVTTIATKMGKFMPLPFFHSFHPYFKVSDISKAFN